MKINILNKTSFSIYIVSLILLFSCNVEPEPINWGKDACSYCKMNIVDKMHAAEYVTPKGKIFKYDAIECLVNDLIYEKFPERKFTLVSDYGNDGKFIDASCSIFLISKNIPSPMGEYLSAFSKNETAKSIQTNKQGKLYNWDELIEEFSKK